MGDAEGGDRQPPWVPPSVGSIEATLLECCAADIISDVLVVGHHGSLTSSRRIFLNATGATTFVISSGPARYGSVTLPDRDTVTELETRGAVWRTDRDDAACALNPEKTGPDADGKAGGCSHVVIRIPIAGDAEVEYSPLSGSGSPGSR
jgi:competence protein ComEC